MSDTNFTDPNALKILLSNSLKKVKAAEGKDGLAFAACVAKPFYGLLFGKSPSEKIGPTHKKTLTELTGASRFLAGTCVFEQEAYTFVIDPVPAGLAKNLKKCLREYTGQTYKIRVRDPEGKMVLDADAEAAEGDTATVAAQTTTAPPASQSAVPPAKTAGVRFLGT
jgi:hypothetical protein